MAFDILTTFLLAVVKKSLLFCWYDERFKCGKVVFFVKNNKSKNAILKSCWCNSKEIEKSKSVWLDTSFKRSKTKMERLIILYVNLQISQWRSKSIKKGLIFVFKNYNSSVFGSVTNHPVYLCLWICIFGLVKYIWYSDNAGPSVYSFAFRLHKLIPNEVGCGAVKLILVARTNVLTAELWQNSHFRLNFTSATLI